MIKKLPNILGTGSGRKTSKVEPGDIAPDFTLPNQNGEFITLSAFKGRKDVILYFYCFDFSVGCSAQAKVFASVTKFELTYN